MRLLIDTNIIVDHLVAREPFRERAKAIFDFIAKGKAVGYVNTSSVTDVYYLLRKTFSDTESREKIRLLLNLFQTVEVTKTDCFSALDSSMPDFEDALVNVCAEKVNADFIITRDAEFLKISKAISPSDFLDRISQ